MAWRVPIIQTPPSIVLDGDKNAHYLQLKMSNAFGNTQLKMHSPIISPVYLMESQTCIVAIPIPVKTEGKTRSSGY